MKINNISIQTMYRWNRILFSFLKMYFVTRLKLAFMRNLLKCNSDFTKNHTLVQPCNEVNIAIATIALLVARVLHGLAVYDLMGFASQLGYFMLVLGKI